MSKVQRHIVSKGREAWMDMKAIDSNPFCAWTNGEAYILWRIGYKAAGDVEYLIYLCEQGNIGNWK